MKTIFWNNATPNDKEAVLSRPLHKSDLSLTQSVQHILADVKAHGDEALYRFSQQFDHVDLKEWKVPSQVLANALAALSPSLRQAIENAKANITTFHRQAYPTDTKVETLPGVHCQLLWRPLEVVGLYVPGGSAPLFSSVLMQAIPAHIAGCPHILLCTPPQKDGTIHPAILAAAQLCGITNVYALGGAQAIAAMAYGSTSIPKVDKIFGPGNAYVTEAKQQVSQDPLGAAIDMPAGPSEVMVIALPEAHPSWVAADLIAQAEHDIQAQAILVTTDDVFAQKVEKELQFQLASLPRRAIAEQSLADRRVVIVPDMATALEVANRYAPEHLIIHNDDAETWLPHIHHAGSVFCGSFTPESAGDYASGTNHVLPTNGYARAYNGLNIYSFMKSMTVQHLTRKGLHTLSDTIITMAEAEGLAGHARAVSIRKETKA